MHPKKERTFVILKPDAIQRGLVGDIINRFEKKGLKIVAMKMFVPKEDQCWEHYKKDDAWFTKKGERIVEGRKNLGMSIEKEAIEYGRDIIRALVKYMTCSPVVAMVIEGNEAQAIVKKLVGSTEPATAEVGTIRGDYTLDSYNLVDTDGGRAVRNLVHCTDKEDGLDAWKREMDIWFTAEEVIDYKLVSEKMLYDVNLDGHLE